MINQSLLLRAIELAKLSVLNNKHGAVLFTGSTIHCGGTNSDRTRILKQTCPSEHAEMNCLTTYFKQMWGVLRT